VIVTVVPAGALFVASVSVPANPPMAGIGSAVFATRGTVVDTDDGDG
jgi:hypothetical protein